LPDSSYLAGWRRRRRARRDGVCGPTTVDLPFAELSEYQAALGRPFDIPEVAPMFRVRLECLSLDDEVSLLSFLRRDGVFAYQVAGGGVEAVAVESVSSDAPRGLVSRVADWLAATDAALNIWLP
jgi:hypothetical protein